MIKARAIKEIDQAAIRQKPFQYLWMFGDFSPEAGQAEWLIITCLNTVMLT